MKKLAAVFVLMPLLAGCGDDGQAKGLALKQCQDQSMTKPMNELQSFFASCMGSKGYVFDGKAPYCETADIGDESPACYRKADPK